MYWFFAMAYAEMACAIPRAGGGFEYVLVAFGRRLGFVCGFFQIVEFVLAAPAIALGMAHFLHYYFPFFSETVWSLVLFIFFTLINWLGVRLSAIVEVGITLVALAGLLFFYVYVSSTTPLKMEAFAFISSRPVDFLSAIPFVIWFFLAIEGLGNLAEDVADPSHNIRRGFQGSLTLLTVVSLFTLHSVVLAGGVEGALRLPGQEALSDAPLLNILAHLGRPVFLQYMFTAFGLVGLAASFNGLILAGSKLLRDFALHGFAPDILGLQHDKTGVARPALIFNTALGLVAVLTGRSGDMITLSAFGALGLYLTSMLAFIRLRRRHPHLPRSFVFRPGIPAVWFVIGVVSVAMAGMVWSFPFHFMIIFFLGLVFYFVAPTSRLKSHVSSHSSFSPHEQGEKN
jgi:ethanolamine permease